MIPPLMHRFGQHQRRASALLAALFAAFLCVGCGGSGPDIRAPENPQPLPEPVLDDGSATTKDFDK